MTPPDRKAGAGLCDHHPMITIEPDLHWHFVRADGARLEPLALPLLAALAERGKLTEAAAACGFSYRHAWALLRDWEAFFGAPLVAMARGRGTRLTALGERLLWVERRLRARLGPQLDSLASELEAELAQALSSARPRLRIHASHGFAIAALRELLAGDGAVGVELQYRGSLEALASLAHGGCEVAGFHLPIGELEAEVLGRYTPWLLADAGLTLIRLATRTQGLMLAPGNPQSIAGLADLARPGVRFVNRQPSSGTRLLFDQLLERAGIEPGRIRGYRDEEFTHAAVAAYVASGMADAGIGVETAARQLGLDFVPLATERYWLACRREALERPALHTLLETLRSAAFAAALARLPGYDGRGAGELVELAVAFPALAG